MGSGRDAVLSPLSVQNGRLFQGPRREMGIAENQPRGVGLSSIAGADLEEGQRTVACERASAIGSPESMRRKQMMNLGSLGSPRAHEAGSLQRLHQQLFTHALDRACRHAEAVCAVRFGHRCLWRGPQEQSDTFKLAPRMRSLTSASQTDIRRVSN